VSTIAQEVYENAMTKENGAAIDHVKQKEDAS
jgi:hypothetical protein